MASVGKVAARSLLHPSTSFLGGSLPAKRCPAFGCPSFPCSFQGKLRKNGAQSCSFTRPAQILLSSRDYERRITSQSQKGASRRVLCSALKEKEETNGKAEAELLQKPENSQNKGPTLPPDQQPTSKQTEKNLEAQVKGDTGAPSEAVFRQLRQEKQRADKLAAKTEQLAQELEEVKQKASEEKQSYENLTWRQKRVIAGKRDSVGGTLAELVEDLGQAALAASSVLLGRKEKGPPAENLDIAKIRKCFSYTTYFPTDSQRYGRGAIFPGNLRGPIEDIAPKLKAKISEELGVEVVLFFLIDEYTDKQACVVQPKAEIDERLEQRRLGGVARWPLSLALLAATMFTTVFLSRVSLGPSEVDAGFEHAVPLLGGLTVFLGASEICQRLTARKYGIKLSPPYLIPSGWLGFLGVATEIESVLPSRKALFDVAASRAAAGWFSSLSLAIAAFLQDGGVNGGAHPLYVQPNFFQPNFLLSFIQYVIGPYADELGNVLPHAVPELGVPVNPVAFAGLLGMVITSLNLLPTGRLEGGRIAQALFGRAPANRVSIFTAALLGVGGFSGSILCLAWGFIILLFRRGEELPAEDEITPLGQGRTFFGWVLLSICILTLLPNSAGTFPSTFFIPAAFQGEP
ncbi:hypothetical protein KFL_000300320 [Klebsormidium nitens]|uniref:Uncharacterized protein n=1 Tax=Klebsormidium nitens TaxID=105231 RepID=A0A0U9HRH8_KLENI|nr:hypothetical protein KFL_000300320 [Klebsormidium nitens]|eukprot:GAQ79434.1 hypothetical protein KFL_000300320 [Klebsormidium nitens]